MDIVVNWLNYTHKQIYTLIFYYSYYYVQAIANVSPIKSIIYPITYFSSV